MGLCLLCCTPTNPPLSLSLAIDMQAAPAKRTARASEDMSDSAHSLKRMCSSALTVQPPHLVIDVHSLPLGAGISPRLPPAYDEAPPSTVGAAAPELGMWSVLPDDALGGGLTLCSPTGQQWQIADLLREPDTPNLSMLHALPGVQRECLMEAARLFLTNAQPATC